MNGYAYAALTGARRTLAARADLVTQTGMMLLVVLALASVWHAALRGGTLGGYDWRALVWYVTLAEACTVPVPGRAIEELGDDIGSGEVAVAMLRPASVAGVRMAMEFGAAQARQIVCLLAAGAFAWLLVGAPPSWSGIGLALLAAPLGIAISIALQNAFGGAAFWVRDARSTWFLFQKFILIGGGVLIPLDLLPPALAAACRPLPFAAIAYIPGRLAAGRGDATLLLMQCAWLAVSLLLAFAVFARGQRRLEVLGG